MAPPGPLLTRKFSQFVQTGVQRAAGLTNGANAIGPFEGSGGGNTATIIQDNTFIPGQWVRIDNATTLYVLALSDTPKDAESWWLVTAATPTQFTIQGGVTRVDFSTFTTVVPDILPFFIGAPQYLSDTTPGLMTYTPPMIQGEVNKPLFIADGPTTGWILSARGYIEGVNQGSPDMSNLVPVNQPGNTFAVGNVIYATTTPNTYALAISSGTFAQSDRVGVVVTAGNPTFIYQTEGNAVNVITQDDTFAAINPGVRYWLSPTRAGYVTATQPTGTNYSVPVYLPYAASGGIITPQRSLLATTSSPFASPPILLGRLDSTNTWSDPTIFNNNGGPFGSYLLIFNPNVSSGGHGLGATGANPIDIGFQFAANGTFYTGTLYQSLIGGTTNRTGLNTGTTYAYCDDTSTTINYATIFHSLDAATAVALNDGSWTLIDNAAGAGMAIEGNGYCTDFSAGNVPTNHNYTVTGNSAGANGGALGNHTSGIQLIFSGVGTTITSGLNGYFTVWGIPNS